MQTETNRNWWRATWVAGLLIVAVSGCRPTGGDFPPAVRTAAQYDQVLAEAAKLSHNGLHNFEEGYPHSETDLKDLKQAYKLFQGLADSRPSNYANYLALGKISRALGDKDSAMRHFQQAVQLRPSTVRAEDKPALAECAAELARMLFEAEQLQGALGYINDAIADAPDDPRHYAMLGHIMIQQRDIPGAQKALDHALKLDPKNEEANALRELIRQAQDDQKPKALPR